MNVGEIKKKLSGVDDKLTVLVRGENVVAGIDGIYIDHDHSDDSPFLAIELEPEG